MQAITHAAAVATNPMIERRSLRAGCVGILKGYEAEKCLLDDDMIGHAQDVTDRCALILELLESSQAPSLLARCRDFIAGFEDDDSQEGVRALMADLRIMLAPPSAKFPETPREMESRLCEELEAWSKAQGLEFRSADEMLHALTNHDEMSATQEDQADYLRGYIERWDACEEFSREMAQRADACAVLEGWALFSPEGCPGITEVHSTGDTFETDADALAHVVRCAAAGSLVHRYSLEQCTGRAS